LAAGLSLTQLLGSPNPLTANSRGIGPTDYPGPRGVSEQIRTHSNRTSQGRRLSNRVRRLWLSWTSSLSRPTQATL